MADVHSKAIRSYNMSRIRSKNTKPELLVRKFLFSVGFRYRLHDKRLYGNPDIVLRKYKAIIFIHGCFWHGHDSCRFAVSPKSNIEYWNSKIEKNRLKDLAAKQHLERAGWNVFIIWECDLKKDSLNRVLDTLVENLRNQLV